jgi:ZIP family zinc transporter
MPDITSAPVLIAFAVTLGAGLATALGAIFVFRTHHSNPRVLAFGLAFAAGAMVYVSLVEIFVKSQISFTEGHGARTGYILATLSLFAGILMVMALDRFVPGPHANFQRAATPADRERIARTAFMAALAITAHNFPEGMATFFATLENPSVGAPLAFAIAIHNIPEGVSIALPVYYATGSRAKATLAATASGVAEFVGALLGYLVLAPFLSPTLYGVIFGMVAGVMVFLSLDELLPAAKRYAQGHETVYGMVLGMGLLALSLILFK